MTAVAGGNMKTVSDFMDLMRLARDKRRAIVLSLLFAQEAPTSEADELELAELFKRLDAATRLTSPNKVQLDLGDPTGKDKESEPRQQIHLDVKDELRELRADLAFLAQAQETGKLSIEPVLQLCSHEEDGRTTALTAEAESVAALVRSRIPNLVLITDWDGTMKDYGSNYSTCVQPAYSAVVLCRFAEACTRFAAVLTAGPLRQPGILDLTAVPVARGFLAYGGCWGREWELKAGRFVQDSHISTGAREVDRVTFGIQNVSGCVSSEETEMLVSAIKEVLSELDPERTLFHLDRSKYDLEVILSESSTGVVWDKGAGVAFLQELAPDGLDLASSLVLVCGDTASDLPMLRHVLAENPQGTRAVFVNPGQPVKEELARIFAHAPDHYVVASCPQVLHAAMVTLINQTAANNSSI